MQKLKILSWNGNKLNSANKRKQVYHWLIKQNANVICLQETHIKKMDKKYLINKKLGEEFHSLLDKKKRGTVTYIKKELKPKKISADENGRYVANELTYKNEKILLIYMPQMVLKHNFFMKFRII